MGLVQHQTTAIRACVRHDKIRLKYSYFIYIIVLLNLENMVTDYLNKKDIMAVPVLFIHKHSRGLVQGN